MDPNDPRHHQQQYPNYPPVRDPNPVPQRAYAYGNQRYDPGPYNAYAPAWQQSALQNQHPHNSYVMPETQQWNTLQQTPQATNQQAYSSGWSHPTSDYQAFQPPQSRVDLNGGYGVFPQQDGFQQFIPQSYDQEAFQAATVFPNEVSYLAPQAQTFEQPPAQTVSPAAVTSLNLDQYSVGDGSTPQETVNVPKYTQPNIVVGPGAGNGNQPNDNQADDKEPKNVGSGTGNVNKADDKKPKLPQSFSDKSVTAFAAALPLGKLSGGFLVREVKGAIAATASETISSKVSFLLVSKKGVPAQNYRPISLRQPAKRYSKRHVRDELKKRQGDQPWAKNQIPLARKLKLAAKAPADEDVSSEEDDEEDSDDDSASDSDDEDVSPLPNKRPADTFEALRYDVLKAVWAPTKVTLGNADLNERYGRLRSLLENTEYNDAYKEFLEAKKKGDSTIAKDAKKRIHAFRKKYQIILSTLLGYGHKYMRQSIGGNKLLLNAFRIILFDRSPDNPLADGLVHDVLELILQSTVFDSGAIKTFKLDQRMTKWTDESQPDETQKLAKKALTHFKEKMEKGNEVNKASGSADEEKKAPSKTPEPVAGAKRSRPDDTAPAPPAKKLPVAAPPRAGPSALTSRTLSKDGRATVSKTAPAAKPSTNENEANREAPKAKLPLPKTSLLSGLKAASKKSSTEASKAGDTAKHVPKAVGKAEATSTSKAVAPKPAPVKAPKPPVKNPFSFSSMMADIGKPKEIPGPSEKPIEKRAPETVEERKKRERKESRRHLRVSFETDDKLEKVRLFEQYDEEKIRRGENRAFSSAMPEGIMHKMHKELEVDEEEEYEPPEEMSQLDWYNPAPTDLGRIATARLHDNTPRHGGLQPVESYEKSVQDDRERTKLITVYQSTADIPASAKSPPETMDDDFNPEVPFSDPISEFVRTREANERAKPATQNVAAPDMNTLKAILDQVERNRAMDHQNGLVQHPPQYPVSNYQAPAPHYQAPATNYQAPAPYPNMQPNPQAVPNLAAITANLESIFARFAEPKAPEPVAPGFDPSIQKALDVFKQQQATQTPQYQPQYQAPVQQYPAPPPAQPPSQNGQSSNGSKVVAILESLKKYGLPQPNQGQQAPPAVSWQSPPVLPSYEAQAHNGYQPQQATQSYPSQSYPNDYGNDSGRKRAMEPDDQYQDVKRNKGEGKKLPPNYKTVVCSFYRKGSCKKGDACTYRHE